MILSTSLFVALFLGSFPSFPLGLTEDDIEEEENSNDELDFGIKL